MCVISRLDLSETCYDAWVRGFKVAMDIVVD